MAASRPATGYPIHPQGPAYTGPVLPHHYQQYDQPYTQPRCSYTRRFMMGFISVILVLSSVLLLIWFLQRPSKPRFRVDSLSTANFNVSGPYISGNWKVGLVVSNPSKKMSISYEEIQASLYYATEFLSSVALPPFGQGTGTSSTISASFAAVSSYVDAKKAGQMGTDKEARGSVSFVVMVTTRVLFRDAAWRLRPMELKVWCGGLVVDFNSKGGTGNMTGSRGCQVYV